MLRNMSFFRQAILVLIVLLICRLVAMAMIPLNDTTEARYGEIARIMVETGNWVTPMHHYDEPFWAKPPLSTWLSALSMRFLGVSAFSARLPSIFLSIGILCLVWGVAKKHSGEKVATTTLLILAGSLFFFLDAGAVMTDPALLFCTTLTIVSFWRAFTYNSRLWGYLFFIALGLGLLAKGPIALVLTGMPLFIWVLRHRCWLTLWQRLPWISGTLLMIAIAAPWYALAEIRTPGFIHYFIVGEHINRFLKPGWDGDKYGFAHIAPYGMIWVYAILGTLPWSATACAWLVPRAKTLPARCKDNDGWMSYLLLCTLVPLIFFTFARNIIYPYVFPSLPTFALLYAELLSRMHLQTKNQIWLVSLTPFFGIGFVCASFLFMYQPTLIGRSQQSVINAWYQQHPSANSHLIYWTHKIEYSAQFYSAGRAIATLSPARLCRLLSNQTDNYVVVDGNERTPIPTHIRQHLTTVTSIPFSKHTSTLFHANVFNCA